MKNLPQGSNTTVVFILCSKQVKDVIFKFPINGHFCWVTHVLCAIYSTLFTSGRSVDDVLMKFTLIEQIIMDVNLICISFSIKHPQIFWESWNVQNYLQYAYIPISPTSGDKNISRKSWSQTKISKELSYVDH